MKEMAIMLCVMAVAAELKAIWLKMTLVAK